MVDVHYVILDDCRSSSASGLAMAMGGELLHKDYTLLFIVVCTSIDKKEQYYLLLLNFVLKIVLGISMLK